MTNDSGEARVAERIRRDFGLRGDPYAYPDGETTGGKRGLLRQE